MCVPIHISRPVFSRGIMAGALFCCAFLCGCGSLPRLTPSLSVEQFAGRSVDEIPTPVFDRNIDDSKPNTPGPRIASSAAGKGIVSAPKPFAWEVLGKSTGGHNIEGVRVGSGGYRVLIIGSLSGNDPDAIDLTEALARHIHENSIILGGIQATIVRTGNPDAERNGQLATAPAARLNRLFPGSDLKVADARQKAEIGLLLDLIEEERPQRIIHIRSYPGVSGIIAATSGTAGAAKDVSEWHDLKFIELPGPSRDGTLERYIATQQSCDIVTFAFPSESDDDAPVWQTYGDTLLNLLLDEDFESRKLAREKLRLRGERTRNRQ